MNLKTDKALAGVLWAQRGQLLVLKDTALHEAGRVAAIDGDVLVERANVDFVQVLPGA